MTKQDKLFVDNDNDANQSCPPIMEEDITRSINQQDIRIVRSQQFRRTAMDDSSLNRPHEGNKNQPVVEGQRHHQKSFSEQKIEVKAIYKKQGTDFGCQKVQSVQMSCEEYTYRSGSNKSKNKNKTQNNQQEQQEPRTAKKSKKAKQTSPRRPYFEKKIQEFKQDVLNVLIAGSEDIGKTIYIRCFKKKQKKSQQPYIKQRTKDIRYEMGMMDQNLVNRRNSVNFIDLPGFKEQEKDKYLRQIKQYARQQWKNYRLKPQQDRRIHCCLYFMRGPRIKQSDLIVMKQLSIWFNLIPVIAKSDQYTKQEIFEIKQEFHRRVAQVGIQVFNIEEFYRVKNGTQGLDEFMKSSFGRFPPFVIASSFEKLSPQSNDFVRKYPWGKVDIQNKDHTDFQKLCDILSGSMRSQLISNLVNIETIQEQELVENIEGVIGEPVQDKVKTGWKAKLVVGSVVVAVVYALLSRKSGGVSFFKE